MKTSCVIIHFLIVTVLFSGADSFARGQKNTKETSQSRPQRSSDLFLIQTVDGERLEDRLKQCVEAISQPIGNGVMGADTLAVAGEFKGGSAIPVGTIFRLNGLTLTESLDMGHISIVLGSTPIDFEPAEHRWQGISMTSEFVSRKTPIVEGLKLTREICVDRQGRVFVSLQLTGQNASGRKILKTQKLCYRLTRNSANQTGWRVWYRQPDGTMIRPGLSGAVVNCDVVGNDGSRKPNDLFLAVDPNSAGRDKTIETNGKTSAGDVELESRISKPHAIGSIMTAMKRWNVREFPAWDSPEPWLNKLWAGEVFSIGNQLMREPATGELVLRNDSAESLRYVWDLRWMKDASIGRRAIHDAAKASAGENLIDKAILGPAGQAMLNCQPDSELQELVLRQTRIQTQKLERQMTITTRVSSSPCMDETVGRYLLANYAVLADWAESANGRLGYRKKADAITRRMKAEGYKAETAGTLRPEKTIADYEGFLHWCRAFYANGDFNQLIGLTLSRDGRRVEKKEPIGVFDEVVTNVVGVRAEGKDRVSIRPAGWASQWPYFCIDNLPYRGHNLTIVWQSPNHAKRYRDVDAGMNVFVDGRLVKQTEKFMPVEIELK